MSQEERDLQKLKKIVDDSIQMKVLPGLQKIQKSQKALRKLVLTHSSNSQSSSSQSSKDRGTDEFRPLRVLFLLDLFSFIYIYISFNLI